MSPGRVREQYLDSACMRKDVHGYAESGQSKIKTCYASQPALVERKGEKTYFQGPDMATLWPDYWECHGHRLLWGG